MYQDGLGSPVDPQELVDPSGTWSCLEGDFEAFREYRAADELSFMEWLRSYRDTRMIVEYASDDLGPFNYFVLEMARRVMGRFTRPWSNPAKLVQGIRM
jgi:hypothetical protein